MDDKFVTISSSQQVAIGSEKMIKALDRQYANCELWIKDNISGDD